LITQEESNISSKVTREEANEFLDCDESDFKMIAVSKDNDEEFVDDIQ